MQTAEDIDHQEMILQEMQEAEQVMDAEVEMEVEEVEEAKKYVPVEREEIDDIDEEHEEADNVVEIRKEPA